MEGLDRSEVLLEFFRAVGDVERLQIVGLLARQEHSVEELAAILGMSSATVSHHLERLVRVGLVAARAGEQVRVFSLRLQALQEMSEQILSGEDLQQAAVDPDMDAYDRKVLRDYMEGGRLKIWPHKWKKRQVILRYLLEQFEPGRRYSEREVNEIIGRVHPDFATLRREMIDTRLLARERDVYWRKE